jgi:WD40 repeat protein
MGVRRAGETPVVSQGVQHGDHNVQHNYFAPTSLFVGAFERLRDVSFDPGVLKRDLDLERFTGRERLIERIDEFIATKSRGYVVVLAEAGVGKSSLAAHLALTRPWLHHFTMLPGGRSPEAARKSLAAQLIARWGLLDAFAPKGVLPASAGRPDWFDRLLWAAATQRDERSPGEPIVLVVDGLDEAEADATGITGLPLGLPTTLPDGVFVVATSRFGIDRALHAVRNPSEWLEIQVEGHGNLNDMERFIWSLARGSTADAQLVQVLEGRRVDITWFQRTLAERCAGVWIYLRYVLEEIRDGTRDPREVNKLPGDLAGYYAQQVARWRGDPAFPTDQAFWEETGLPLLGVLAAARAPLTVRQLARFAAVARESAVRTFVEETVRAFLKREPETGGPARYSVRHQSLRDFLSGVYPENRPDVQGLAEQFAEHVSISNRSISNALIPPGEPGTRNWQSPDSYFKDHLAAHAAVCGMLDDLVNDPGFLMATRPETVLVNRGSLMTSDGRMALGAFNLSLAGTGYITVDVLAANAARIRATRLLAACRQIGDTAWPISWAAWSGRKSGKRTDSWIYAVATGRAAGRDIIVSGSADRTVRIWDAVTGAAIGRPLIGHDLAVLAVAMGRAAGRDIIVSGSADRTVGIWDAGTGVSLRGPLAGHYDEVNAVATGRIAGRDILVSGSADRTVRIWDATTGEAVGGPIGRHSRAVHAVTTGRVAGRDLIVAGCADRRVYLWDAVTGAAVGHPMAGHSGAVHAVAMGRIAGRDVIISGSRDTTIRIWDTSTGDPIGRALAVDDWPVYTVAAGQRSGRDIIASGSAYGTVRIWDAATGLTISEAQADSDPAETVGTYLHRTTFASGSTTFGTWAAHAPLSRTLAGHHDAIYAVAAGRVTGRDVIVSGSADRTICVWDATTGERLGRPLSGHYGAVCAVAIARSLGQDVVISGSDDRTVRIWDTETGETVGRPLAGHDQAVYAVAAGRIAGRDVIVSGSADRTVRVWDTTTGEAIIRPIVGHNLAVYTVAIGRLAGHDVIISGSRDTTIRVWDAETGRAVGRALVGHDQAVYAVAAGRVAGRDVIVSGSADHTVRLWDATTGELIACPMASHSAPVSTVAIGMTGPQAVIVSGSWDGAVRIWDAATATSLDRPLGGHSDTVAAVAIVRSGEAEVIASAGNDRTLLLRRSRHANR